jgi:antirestriction protein ArdC
MTTDERKQRIKDYRKILANLSPADRQRIAATGQVTNLDGHTLSLTNTILLHLQAQGITPTVVAGYQQWRRAGKQVRRGEHGSTIWFPTGRKNDGAGDDLAAETHEGMRFFTTTVFDISQVDPIEVKEVVAV